MQLSKTNFLQYLKCSKSLWILKHKPEKYPTKKGSAYEDKLAVEGYEVQKIVQNYLSQKDNSQQYSYEKPYKTNDGLYAAADIIFNNKNGTVDVYEVKSSGSIDDSHVIDATFQTIAIEESGVKVEEIYIVHLNKNYVREDTLDVEKMMIFKPITNQVRNLVEKIRTEINEALKLLKKNKINETGCSCLELSRSHHCDTFNYFNPTIPKISIYNIPRIGKKKLKTFVNENRFDLKEIEDNEVSKIQLNILKAAKYNHPVVNKSIIETFYSKINYPIYFLDYETYSSAIPIIKGIKPHSHIPFQFSIHLKQSKDDHKLIHFEFLADKAELPLKLIEKMEKIINLKGTVISWHKSFENTRNDEMSILYPPKKNFLKELNKITVDLEEIFKEGYVDINFDGSTSIKKVLPIIVPELNYNDLVVANGTDAMEAFKKMLKMPQGVNKGKLRSEMLKYCKLDTLAMVKIFEKIENKILSI